MTLEMNENPVPNMDSRPAYQRPTITTYSSEEILEQVGPAKACTINDSPIS